MLLFNIASAQNPLHEGTIFKIKVTKTAVYQVDFQWLLSHIPDLQNDLPVANISLWSGSGGLRPISYELIDDRDGLFNNNDQIIFYASGPDDDWHDFKKNTFSSENYIYLVFGGLEGQRIAHVDSDHVRSAVDYYLHHGHWTIDRYNLLHESINNSGSGQVWVGEEISNLRTIDLEEMMDWHTYRRAAVRVRADVMIRSDKTESVTLEVGDTLFTARSRPVVLGDPEDHVARRANIDQQLMISQHGKLSLGFEKNSTNARAWIDEVHIYGSRSNTIYGPDVLMNASSDHDGLIVPTEGLTIWKNSGTHWYNILPADIDGKSVISTQADDKIIMFDRAQLTRPDDVVSLDSVVIPEFQKIDMLILHPPDLAEQANRLASHRSDKNGWQVQAVDVQNIYEIYGSGQQSPLAIYSYLKEIYHKNIGLHSVLLLGDASFDYRGIYNEYHSELIVPTFETTESLDPILSFPTDDYYALLDEDTPTDLSGDLDIAVGRIPVSSVNEAREVIDKIIHYDHSASAHGPWKNHIAFLADDEDYNLHLSDTERLSDQLESLAPLFQHEKVYWDAFSQQSTPGGNRYPEAQNRVRTLMEEGVLIMNYLGHGGPIGWSQERVIGINDIDNLNNVDHLPLIMTATCSFTPYDDPTFVSAGERCLLNPLGGAIALFTTVRSVYASQNFQLTKSVFETIFTDNSFRQLPLGEILRRSKNHDRNNNINARKFLLIGDPGLQLAVPKQEIRIQSINNQVLDGSDIDTIGALETIRMSAAVLDQNGNINQSFNGVASVKFYDKKQKSSTLANDASSFVKEFDIQNNILYQTSAEVVSGEFSFEMTLPLDIDYRYGHAKLVLYATEQESGGNEAHGFYDRIVVGGSSGDLYSDREGPLIDAYLDHRDVDQNDVRVSPTLFIDLNDDSGINLSRNSIGHEISVLIDDNNDLFFILNDYFEYSENDIRGGTVEFPIPALSTGPHSLLITAFDIANNVSEYRLDFVVGESKHFVESRVYPNPLEESSFLEIFYINNNNPSSIELSCWDMNGKRHYIQYPESSVSNGIIRLPLQSLYDALRSTQSSGIFLLSTVISDATSDEKRYTSLKKLLLLK